MYGLHYNNRHNILIENFMLEYKFIVIKKYILLRACCSCIYTNIAEVQAQNVVFWLLDDIELVDWTTTNFYLQDYGFVRIITTHLFSN